MVLSLIGPLDNARVQRILLIAAYAGTTLKVVPITVGVENETDSYRRNCHPLARVPVLKSDEGYLFETHAIARYIARTERPYGADGCDRYPSPQHQVPYLLYGKSVKEAAEVDAWLDFVMMEIDTHAFPILNAEKQQQEQQKRTRVTSSRNNNNNNNTTTTTTMPLVSAAELQRLQEALEEGLHGLEQRLVFMKELRRVMGTAAGGGNSHTNGNRQYNNNNNNNDNNTMRALSSARTGTLDEVEDGLSEEDMYISSTPRESAVLRGYHTYNIKTRMEVPPDANHNNNNNNNNNNHDDNNNNNNINNNNAENMGDGNMMLPRLSTQTPRLSTQTPRRSANPNAGDLLFLVGDSLTAADLVVAAGVNNALQAKCVQPTARQQYPQLVRYVSGIMRLPVAAEVRKAVGMSLI